MFDPAPFREDLEGARLRFNTAHKKTRCTIERAYGVLKEKFYALQKGMRVRSMKRAAELVQCAVILHNLCILFSDNGDELLDDADLDIVDDELNIDHGEEQEDRRQRGSAAVRNDTNYTLKLQLFQYRQKKIVDYAPFFGEVISCIEVLN